MPPRISIVTPCLNSEATLRRCLDAVWAQRAHVLEHIVVDGGSTDGTLPLLHALEAERAPFLRVLPGPDRGIADAFNKGIAAARGDWIGIINADDWYDDGVLERLLPNMGAEAILHGRMRAHEPDGRSREIGKRPYDPQRHFRPLEAMPAQHPTCFVPASVYARVGPFDTAFRIAMDYDFLQRAHLAGVPFRHLDLVIANFSRGGASGRNPVRAAREMLASQVLHQDRVLKPLLRYAAKRWRLFVRGRR